MSLGHPPLLTRPISEESSVGKLKACLLVLNAKKALLRGELADPPINYENASPSESYNRAELINNWIKQVENRIKQLSK